FTWFSGGTSLNPGPFVNLYLTNIQSNAPTLILTGVYLSVDIVPDVDLTNMSARVSLGRLHPTADKQAIDYDGASGSFSFDYDVYDWPNWLATEFVDVQGKVQTRASERIAGAFEKDTTHAALSKVLTTLVDGFIK